MQRLDPESNGKGRKRGWDPGESCLFTAGRERRRNTPARLFSILFVVGKLGSGTFLRNAHQKFVIGYREEVDGFNSIGTEVAKM